jgi:arsenate reductase
MLDRPFSVLFLCTGNSARSILAEGLLREGLLRQLGDSRFNAFSAGSFSGGEVHPLALGLLAEQGFATGRLRSKSWDGFAAADAPVMDFVVKVCDQATREVCPIWPGQPVAAHWGIPDPAATENDGSGLQMLAFREAFRMLERRIQLFVALPIASLSRLALKRRIDTIGRLRPDRAENRAS